MKEQLKGTWLYIKTRDDYGKTHLIEFYEDKIKHFDIENIEVISLRKSVNETWNEKLSEAELKIINPNRLMIVRNGKKHSVFCDEKSITENWKFENHYEKLNATETELTESEIQNLKFEFNWNGEKKNIKFNENLDSPIIQEINLRMKNEGSKIVLEKLNETLFLSLYNDKYSDKMIPIKYVDKKKMILYGFPREPYEINCKITK